MTVTGPSTGQAIAAGRPVAAPPPAYHTGAVVLWLIAALLPALLTANPFYLLLLLLGVGGAYGGLGRARAEQPGWGSLLKMSLLLVLFSIIFNLLLVNVGRTPLLALPELRWTVGPADRPTTLLRLGGQITLESLAFGLSRGLALLAVLLVFATFNLLIDHYQLLRSLPRFLYQSAIVLSIAITFIPQMVLAQREIRQAQALRGHRFRRLRDLLPLFLTLLAEGLERSLTLAESMEARGFARRAAADQALSPLLSRGLIALALALLLAGAFGRGLTGYQAVGNAGLGLGGLLLAGTLWRLGRGVQRSRYRRELWRRADTLLAASAGLTAGLIALTWLTDRAALIFYPYPQISLPPFRPLLGLACLLTIGPALAGKLSQRGSQRGAPEGLQRGAHD